MLQTLPADGVMSLDGMDGYLTALLVGPGQPLKQLPTDQWLPLIWGGDTGDDAAPFPSKRQRKATVVLVLRHLRHVQHQIFQAPDDWEPIFSVAEQGAQRMGRRARLVHRIPAGRGPAAVALGHRLGRPLAGPCPGRAAAGAGRRTRSVCIARRR